MLSNQLPLLILNAVCLNLQISSRLNLPFCIIQCFKLNIKAIRNQLTLLIDQALSLNAAAFRCLNDASSIIDLTLHLQLQTALFRVQCPFCIV